MIALKFDSISLPADTKVKVSMASKQMQSLMELLKNAPAYHTLTTSDRARLKRDAYADDLVDNLVLGTSRVSNGDGTFKDPSLLGFTYAAFDPSLYGGKELQHHFQQINKGCCCYCETFQGSTNSGHIGHFRPVNLLNTSTQGKHTSDCSPYYSLAYEQSNLVYSCDACNAQHKAALFPVDGKRFPEVSLNAEDPLLINPYQENPRDHIRFNPQNACAYPYDQVLAFFQQTKGLSENEVSKMLWSSPAEIPNQVHSDGTRLSNQETNEAFNKWKNNSQNLPQKGQTSIELLGLNRQPLLLARLGALSSFQHLFSQFDISKVTFHPISEDDIQVFQYRSLAVDAFNSWYWQSQDSQQPAPTDSQQPANAEINSNHLLQQVGVSNSVAEAVSNPQTQFAGFPDWFRSCFMYLVLESQLLEQHKRSLVLLHSEDALYGKKSKEKCLLLPVNWQDDQHKVIKVKSFRNIWETSFAELASSRPMELLNIFANNQVWVEGTFPPLISNES